MEKVGQNITDISDTDKRYKMKVIGVSEVEDKKMMANN